MRKAVKDRERVNLINRQKKYKEREKRSSRQKVLEGEAEKQQKKRRSVCMCGQLRETDRVSDSSMGVEEGVSSMSIQMLNHSRAFHPAEISALLQSQVYDTEKRDGYRSEKD